MYYITEPRNIHTHKLEDWDIKACGCSHILQTVNHHSEMRGLCVKNAFPCCGGLFRQAARNEDLE